MGVELSDGHFGLEDVLQHDNGNLLLEESPILVQSEINIRDMLYVSGMPESIV